MALAIWPDFCNGTYRFPNDQLLGSDSCKNLLPIKLGGDAKGPFGLTNIPGKELKVTLATSPGRGVWSGDEQSLYAVSGDTLYKVDLIAYTAASFGAVQNDSSPVQFASNGSTQLGVVSNRKLWVSSGGAAVEITTCPASVSGGGTGVGALVFTGGYGIVFGIDTNTLWVSAINDLTTWDVLDKQTWFATQDRIVQLSVDKNGLLWIWGRKTFEPWQQIPNPGTGFPFAQIKTAGVSVGLASRYSVGLVPQLNGTDQQCFLAQNERGTVSVYTLQGYTAVRISNDSIENIIGSYTLISDCVLNGYWSPGHRLALFSFPDAGSMLGYDFNTGMWHERYYGPYASYTEPLGRYHTAPVNMIGKHYWLSGTTGKLYLDNRSIYTDEGNPIYWERIGPNANNAQQEMFCGLFRLDIQSGEGTSVGGVTLEVSRNNGKTFGAARARSTGTPGQFDKELNWERNGTGASFVPRIRGSDAVRVAIVGAAVDLEPGLGY